MPTVTNGVVSTAYVAEDNLNMALSTPLNIPV